MLVHFSINLTALLNVLVSPDGKNNSDNINDTTNTEIPAAPTTNKVDKENVNALLILLKFFPLAFLSCGGCGGGGGGGAVL